MGKPVARAGEWCELSMTLQQKGGMPLRAMYEIIGNTVPVVFELLLLVCRSSVIERHFCNASAHCIGEAGGSRGSVGSLRLREAVSHRWRRAITESMAEGIIFCS